MSSRSWATGTAHYYSKSVSLQPFRVWKTANNQPVFKPAGRVFKTTGKEAQHQMNNTVCRRLLAVLSLCFAAAGIAAPSSLPTPSTKHTLTERLAQQAPTLSKAVLTKAIAAMDCAVRGGQPGAERLAVID